MDQGRHLAGSPDGNNHSSLVLVGPCCLLFSVISYGQHGRCIHIDPAHLPNAAGTPPASTSKTPMTKLIDSQPTSPSRMIDTDRRVQAAEEVLNQKAQNMGLMLAW